MAAPSIATMLLSCRLRAPTQRADAVAEVARTAELLGSVEALARLLIVPVRTLRRWLAEDEELRDAVRAATGRHVAATREHRARGAASVTPKRRRRRRRATSQPDAPAAS